MINPNPFNYVFTVEKCDGCEDRTYCSGACVGYKKGNHFQGTNLNVIEIIDFMKKVSFQVQIMIGKFSLAWHF